MRRIHIFRLLNIALIVTVAIVGYAQPRLWGQASPDTPALRRELGVDDGFACVLFYGSDISGNLETCG